MVGQAPHPPHRLGALLTVLAPASASSASVPTGSLPFELIFLIVTLSRVAPLTPPG